MPIHTPHPDYARVVPQWARCRDVFDGSDRIKSRGVEYLPSLTWSSDRQAEKYAAYLLRALFYPALQRTVTGMAGLIFAKELTLTGWPASLDKLLNDITQDDCPLSAFAVELSMQILTVGRVGVLVDMPAAPNGSKTSSLTTTDPEAHSEGVKQAQAETRGPAMPYWVMFTAEQILNWKLERVGSTTKLTRLVLRVEDEIENPKDPYDVQRRIAYKLFEINALGNCEVSLWTSSDKEDAVMIEPPTSPIRRGVPLPFIPFQCINASTLGMDVQKPPLLDLVDVNLSHYRSSADLEHGRHYTALPTPWIAGSSMPAGDPIPIGSGIVLDLKENGRAGMLEFTGQGLKALDEALAQKERMMAVLGARLLEQQPKGVEAAETVRMRHAGEQAVLKTIAKTLSAGLTRLLRLTAWWAGVLATPTVDSVECMVNTDFLDVPISSDMLKSLLTAVQAGQMSFETFYFNLQRGGVARPGIDAQEEQAQIESELPDIDETPGEVDADGNPVAPSSEDDDGDVNKPGAKPKGGKVQGPVQVVDHTRQPPMGTGAKPISRAPKTKQE